MLTTALAKGRLADYAMTLFEKLGYDVEPMREDTRRLVFEDKGHGMRFLLVKPQDVPVYVYHGTADIGIAGRDTLLEAGLPLYEMLDLDFGRCSMCVAAVKDPCEADPGVPLRVATKYPRIARMYYDRLGRDIEIIHLNGSIELAPVVGLSDVIMDIVESGSTIRENGLHIFGHVTDISARLVVNRVALKSRASEIRPLIGRLRALLEGNTSC